MNEIVNIQEQATLALNLLVRVYGMELLNGLQAIAKEVEVPVTLTLVVSPDADQDADVRLTFGKAPAADTVTIPRSQHESLLDDSEWRRCLESGGVDNWTHYGDSLRDGGYYAADGA
jgi:hypothetical protein